MSTSAAAPALDQSARRRIADQLALFRINANIKPAPKGA